MKLHKKYLELWDVKVSVMKFVSMNSRNKLHRRYHIFQNIGQALNLKKHQDFNKLILGKYIYTHENLKLTYNFQINLQRSTNFLVDKVTTEDFSIPITFTIAVTVRTYVKQNKIFSSIQGITGPVFTERLCNFLVFHNACLLTNL